MSTIYDRDINGEVLALSRRLLNNQRLNGTYDTVAYRPEVSYQIYEPNLEHIRFNNSGGNHYMQGGSNVEFGTYEKGMFGAGYQTLEQKTRDDDLYKFNSSLKGHVDTISHGAGLLGKPITLYKAKGNYTGGHIAGERFLGMGLSGGEKVYNKKGLVGGLKGSISGGSWDSFWDTIGDGLSTAASDTWSGVKTVANDAQQGYEAMLPVATQAAQNTVDLQNQAGQAAIQTAQEQAPNILQMVNDNPELLVGAGKKTSKWILHVKAYASKHKMSYRDALRNADCKSSYKKVGAGMSGGKKHKKVKKEREEKEEKIDEEEEEGAGMSGGKKHRKTKKAKKTKKSKKEKIEEIKEDDENRLEGGYWNALEPKRKNAIKGKKLDTPLQDIPKGSIQGGGFLDNWMHSFGFYNGGKKSKKGKVEKIEKVEKLEGGKKTSPWIAHVKAYAIKHKCNYRDALRNKECKDSYKK